MKFSLGLDLLDSFMVLWKRKYTVNGVSDVHIVLPCNSPQSSIDSYMLLTLHVHYIPT